jgi:hypothetical protein
MRERELTRVSAKQAKHANTFFDAFKSTKNSRGPTVSRSEDILDKVTRFVTSRFFPRVVAFYLFACFGHCCRLAVTSRFFRVLLLFTSSLVLVIVAVLLSCSCPFDVPLRLFWSLLPSCFPAHVPLMFLFACFGHCCRLAFLLMSL